MKIFVTGAAGYLGHAVVRHLDEAGHDVTALVRQRRAGDALLASCPSADIVVGDLRSDGPWTEAAQSCAAVVHLAAQKDGNLHEQLAGTVATTDKLLRALGPEWDGRFVLASSFAVYDYSRVQPWSTLDESSPVYDPVFDAAPYAQTKLLQERLVESYAASSTATACVLRIAGVYGRGALWNSGLAIKLSDSVGIMFAPSSPMKLVHIDHVADAVVRAVEVEAAPSGPINIVDDDQPTHRAFARRLRRAGAPAPRSLPVPFRLLLMVERLLSRFSRDSTVYPSRADLLSVGGLHGGWLPLRYTNARAKLVLGWSGDSAVDRAAREACSTDTTLASSG
jgi:nucleoside-diphosphate-sugar epimerase